ncbi:MAG: hypothetical protein KG003_08145 [Bacteroidetes bacterium]|nr:hypothetical protein [Bacteroidota bacterium]
MKQTQIEALSGGEFTTQELTYIRRIVIDKSFSEIKNLVPLLTLFDDQDPPVVLPDEEQSERKLMRSHVKVYFDKFLDGTVKVKGGKRGSDFDNTRDKMDLRREVRRMLQLPSLTDEELADLDRIYFSESSNSVPSSRSF